MAFFDIVAHCHSVVLGMYGKRVEPWRLNPIRLAENSQSLDTVVSEAESAMAWAALDAGMKAVAQSVAQRG